MQTAFEKPFKILIAGGGTGGHLFPGIAIATAFRKRFKDAQILFVTGKKKIESAILNDLGFAQTPIRIEGLKGRGWKKGLKVLLLLPVSLWQSFRIIKTFDPDVILGVGGYSSGPVCLAARMAGKPTAIQEQNSYPGLTNRLLSRIVDKVFIAYQESRQYFSRADLFLSGNPLRAEILQLLQEGPNGRHKDFTILVVGGSQGARAINREMITALKILQDRGQRLAVIHQTGADDFEEVRRAYASADLQGEIRPFIKDMARVYRQADIVVSRAGASTLAELAVLGKASILIPFPHAANNHQETNAAVLARAGGAEMVLQRDMSGSLLADLIAKYMQNPAALEQMETRARTVGQRNATEMIVDQLIAMVRK